MIPVENQATPGARGKKKPRAKTSIHEGWEMTNGSHQYVPRPFGHDYARERQPPSYNGALPGKHYLVTARFILTNLLGLVEAWSNVDCTVNSFKCLFGTRNENEGIYRAWNSALSGTTSRNGWRYKSMAPFFALLF